MDAQTILSDIAKILDLAKSQFPPGVAQDGIDLLETIVSSPLVLHLVTGMVGTVKVHAPEHT